MGQLMQTADVLIIGGGIVGLSIARELKKTHRIVNAILEGRTRNHD